MQRAESANQLDEDAHGAAELEAAILRLRAEDGAVDVDALLARERAFVAEADAQAAYSKLVKPVREQQIPACLDGAKRLAQKTRNLTAARHGRPLPFAGLGTAVEIHEAAKKALGAKVNLAELVGAAIDALDIKGPSGAPGAPSISDEDMLDDEPDTVEDVPAA